ncbi:PIN domain-containing protein, partial [Brachyspira sp.]|uniref:PIN domain-containing protein n=1 Tax=Brachyspira sp. TaxID=1977261 RepID=UPI003D7D8814
RYDEMIQNETLKPHLPWFNEIKDKYNDINKNNIDKIINEISSRLQIKRETFKENETLRNTLQNIENMKPKVNQFNDKSVNNFNKIYVIDTNILMNEPKIFNYLDNKSLMVIPNIVVEELDKLKSDKKDENKKQQAFQARESIRNILNNNKPNIRQEDSDTELLPEDFEKNKPDNLILSVALKFTLKDVYLLTDDNDLSAKAKGQNIKYISLEDFKSLKNNNTQNKNNQNNNKKNKKNKK